MMILIIEVKQKLFFCRYCACDNEEADLFTQ